MSMEPERTNRLNHKAHKQQFLCVSYVPHLYPDQFGLTAGADLIGDQEVHQRLDEHLRTVDNDIKGCLLGRDGQHAIMTLAMPKATALVQHMLWWAENEPKHFKLVWDAQERSGPDGQVIGHTYQVVLMPDLQWSIERFKQTIFRVHDQLPLTGQVAAIFAPLAFRSSGVSPSFREVLPRLMTTGNTGGSVRVAFVDVEQVAALGPAPTITQINDLRVVDFGIVDCRRAVDPLDLEMIKRWCVLEEEPYVDLAESGDVSFRLDPLDRDEAEQDRVEHPERGVEEGDWPPFTE